MSKNRLKILFIGEEQSKKAIENNWQWADKRLCSKTLHEAIEQTKFKVEPFFLNLFENGNVNQIVIANLKGGYIRIMEFDALVALGKKVQKVLGNQKIPYVPMIHPAARGKIRKSTNYSNHVQECLKGIHSEKYIGKVLPNPNFLIPPKAP